MASIEIYFDGACDNHPNSANLMGLGVAVFVDKKLSREYSISRYAGKGTNNIAEWQSCIIAFEKAIELKPITNTIVIYSDSQLIVNQFNGLWRMNHIDFKAYHKIAKELALEANYNKALVWIPREENMAADQYSKDALRLPDVQKVYYTQQAVRMIKNNFQL